MPKGGCLCGKVRYEIDGDTSVLWFCHCSKCRKSRGSAFVTAAVCGKKRFRWVSGEDTISEYRTESGYGTRFCSTCGSPAPLLLADLPYVWLPVGTIDGDPGGRVSHHIFVGSKAPWFEISDALPQFEEHAPGP